MSKLKSFVQKNPARVAAWVSATVAIVMAAVAPDMPIEPVVVFVMSTLGLGEYAQRVEDKKTDAALWTDPSED